MNDIKLTEQEVSELWKEVNKLLEAVPDRGDILHRDLDTLVDKITVSRQVVEVQKTPTVVPPEGVMAEREVWEEGFVISGESGKAHLTGRVRATSFQEACDMLYAGKSTYNSEKCTYWGCRLFDNETDARKSFG